MSNNFNYRTNNVFTSPSNNAMPTIPPPINAIESNYRAGYGMTPVYGGGAGYPYPNYEQMMNYRQQLYQQQRAYQQKMLEENYPVKFVIVYSAIVALICITSIIIQILIIIDKAANYSVGSGIWVASYFFIIIALALFISNHIFRFLKFENIEFIVYFFLIK